MASKSINKKTNPFPAADHQSGKPNKANLYAAQTDGITIVHPAASADCLEVDIKGSSIEGIVEVLYGYKDKGSCR